jgi:hypothetical protein
VLQEFSGNFFLAYLLRRFDSDGNKRLFPGLFAQPGFEAFFAPFGLLPGVEPKRLSRARPAAEFLRAFPLALVSDAGTRQVFSSSISTTRLSARQE